MSLHSRELDIAAQAVWILAGLCADAIKIRPDNAEGVTRQEQWGNWAVARAAEEIRRENAGEVLRGRT